MALNRTAVRNTFLVNGMRLQLFPDLPVLGLDGGLRAAVHEEQQHGRSDRPRAERLPDEDVADGRAHEEVEVGQDGHQEERTAEKAVEATTAFRAQILLLKCEDLELGSLFLIRCRASF